MQWLNNGDNMKDELLKKLLDWANSLENLVREQLPPLLQEVSNYGRLCAIFGIVLLLCSVFGGITAILIGSRKARNGEGSMAIGVLVFFLGTIIAGCIISNSIESWFAPRMYFIHELTRK